MTFIIFWRELSRSPDTHAASCEAVYDGCCAARPGKPGATPNADGQWPDVQEGTPIDQSHSSTSCRPSSRLHPRASPAGDASRNEASYRPSPPPLCIASAPDIQKRRVG